MERIQRRLADFQKAGATVVAVSSDPLLFLRPMKQKLKLKFLILSDEDLKLIEKLEVREGKRKIARPCTFVLDAKGHVRWRHIGNHPMDRPAESSILRAIRSIKDDSSPPGK